MENVWGQGEKGNHYGSRGMQRRVCSFIQFPLSVYSIPIEFFFSRVKISKVVRDENPCDF